MLLLADLAALGCTYFCGAGAGCIGAVVPCPARILMPVQHSASLRTAEQSLHATGRVKLNFRCTNGLSEHVTARHHLLACE